MSVSVSEKEGSCTTVEDPLPLHSVASTLDQMTSVDICKSQANSTFNHTIQSTSTPFENLNNLDLVNGHKSECVSPHDAKGFLDNHKSVNDETCLLTKNTPIENENLSLHVNGIDKEESSSVNSLNAITDIESTICNDEVISQNDHIYKEESVLLKDSIKSNETSEFTVPIKHDLENKVCKLEEDKCMSEFNNECGTKNNEGNISTATHSNAKTDEVTTTDTDTLIPKETEMIDSPPKVSTDTCNKNLSSLTTSTSERKESGEEMKSLDNSNPSLSIELTPKAPAVNCDKNLLVSTAKVEDENCSKGKPLMSLVSISPNKKPEESGENFKNSNTFKDEENCSKGKPLMSLVSISPNKKPEVSGENFKNSCTPDLHSQSSKLTEISSGNSSNENTEEKLNDVKLPTPISSHNNTDISSSAKNSAPCVSDSVSKTYDQSLQSQDLPKSIEIDSTLVEKSPVLPSCTSQFDKETDDKNNDCDKYVNKSESISKKRMSDCMENDDFEVKRFKITTKDNNEENDKLLKKSEPSDTSFKEENSDFLNTTEEDINENTERKPNPNKLYQGLLNDVLAEEKDGVKEPEVIRTKLRRIKRKDLEDIIIDQLLNKILYDHELGNQRELCKRLEQTLEAANKKALRLTQEVESLKNISTKVAIEHKKRKMHLVHPTKVKRSVGIQANKSYISQGFASAFLPDTEVRLLTPSKYQKGKRNGDNKGGVYRGRNKEKGTSEFDGKQEDDDEVTTCMKDYSSLASLQDNLNHKLNTLKENLEASRLKESQSAFPGKKAKHSKKQATLNGKQFASDSYEGSSSIYNSSKGTEVRLFHPAPLPHHACPEEDIVKGRVPPGPILRVHLKNKSIILSWNINGNFDENSIHSYQLFSYEETKDPPSTDAWQKIGSVKALELPMACTLTQFKCGRVYHFAVRATTKRGRIGQFSTPRSLRMPLK